MLDPALDAHADGGTAGREDPSVKLSAGALLRVLTGGVDLQGQWRLDGDQLRIEMQELPPNTELFGGRWHGRQLIVHVRTLTDQHLQFVDSDLKFQRGLVPSAKR